MTLTVNHSTSADGSFSATGATAWNAAHTLTGTIDVINGGTGQTTTTAAINALLPTQATNSGKYLTTDGTNTSWATVSGGGSPGGSTTQFQYNNASAFGGSANLVYDGTNVQVNNAAAFRFSNVTTNYVAFKAPASIASNVTWTLPSTDGTAGQVLSTNGSGVLSWVTVTITPTSPTNNTLPVVSGTPTVGQTLSSTSGTWNGYPAPTFAYQWVRGASTNISGATSSSYTLVDADYNNTVKCTVTATNSAGSASATSAATATIAAGVPGAPTIGTATAGNAQATVSFTAPASTGGVAITSYTVTSSPGGFTASGSASPLTVTGLTNGTAYTFTVTATNSVGTGPASAASNSVTPAATLSVDYLVLAGGGGGGYPAGGGGGAGGYLTSTLSLAVATAYTVTVGAGGSGGVGSTVAGTGFNSVLSSVTSTGGGGGGSSGVAPTSGGSGGGAGNGGSSINGAAASPSGQGNAGGNNVGSTPYACGGGGGAGAVGGSGAGSVSGNGGAGAASSITGTSVTRGGGGGGTGTLQGATAGSGGSGGGGGGGILASPNGVAGTANLGGGGGGAFNAAAGTPNGGAGGSGVVIIKIADTRTATFSGGVTSSLSTAVSGFKIYTVTATSTTSETVTFS